MRKILQAATLVLVLSVAALSSAAAQDSTTRTPAEICADATPAENPSTHEYAAPEQVLEAGVDYRAIFCTDAGPVYVDLFEDQAPATVNNFVFLAENRFYNNTTFHRVIDNFMVQGGDPQGTGRGGPGYQFEDEFVSYLRFDRPGLLAMANAGPGTNGSQFFLTTAITDHLDFRHTIFGEVLEGQENVESLPLRDPDTATTPGAALETVVIITNPDEVDTTYTVPEGVASDDILAVLEDFPELPGVVLSEDTGLYETEMATALVSADLQEQYGDFLEQYNHQYTVKVTHLNMECDFEAAPLERIGYIIHVFETPEDAAAAVEDDLLPEIISNSNAHEAMESEVSTTPVYTWETTACDSPATYARMYDRVGRFVIIAESIFPEDSPFPADQWLYQIVRFNIYESVFYDVLRQELSAQ